MKPAKDEKFTTHAHRNAFALEPAWDASKRASQKEIVENR